MLLRPRVLPALTLAALCFVAPGAGAQVFVKVTDAANPIVSDPGPAVSTYEGASWIDYDGDGLPDLFVCRRGLYRNLGAGAFAKVASAQPAQGLSLGNSWADYDNDGDPDLLVASGMDSFGLGGGGTYLFRNDHPAGDLTGAGPFTRVTGGALADSSAIGGWGCAFGDYDRDGRVDFVIAGLPGFTTVPSNHLLRNLGGDAFGVDTSTQVDDAVAPFTVPTWSDYDLDGDLDLFIGSGPATGSLGPDYCYRNTTVGGGGLTRLDRLNTAPYTDNRDGQVWNWIDYDNDGDLDAYVTNYGGATPGLANDLFRNDSGTLTRLLSATIGPIVSDRGLSLASVWGDFDNDGDLDCLVTNDAPSIRNRLYRNDVDSTGKFLALVSGTLVTEFGPHVAACAADYDQDGDLDLYVGGGATKRGLYRNDLAGGLNWADFRLVGSASNRSAIGARIFVLATIKGQPRWQLREVSAQNSFNGQNDLVVHFGLREAAVIDSVRVVWPGGLVESASGLAVRTVHTLVEGATGPTPTLFDFAEATFDGGVVRLTFEGALEPGEVAVLERSDDGAAWEFLATLEPDGTGRVAFDDATAAAGRRWGYRLTILAAGAPVRTSGVTWLELPAATVQFALAAGGANPHAAREALSFTPRLLPGAGPGRLALVDVRGRVLVQRVLPDPTPASPVVLAAGGTLRPGIYWAVLTQGAARLRRQVVVLR